MQNFILKFFAGLCLVTCLMPSARAALSAKGQMQQADSLFEQKHYAKAYQLYEGLYQADKYTPAMFLKMAYIKEGMQQQEWALYYLKLYHALEPERDVLQKMEQMANKYELKGYDIRDEDYLWQYYRMFLPSLKLLLTGLAFLFLLKAGTNWWRQRKVAAGYGIGMLIVAGALLVIFNFRLPPQEAVVIRSNTLLMQGPSAASGVKTRLTPGHCLTIDETGEAWYRVNWEGQRAYVRQSDLLPVRLGTDVSK